MKNYYVTCLIVKENFKKNVKAQVQAMDRESALKWCVTIYSLEGYEVVKSRVIEL